MDGATHDIHQVIDTCLSEFIKLCSCFFQEPRNAISLFARHDCSMPTSIPVRAYYIYILFLELFLIF